MNYLAKRLAATAASVLCMNCAYAQMPTPEALAAETNKQLSVANDAINKATNQASLTTPSIPRLTTPPSNAKAVDPSEIAKRYKEFSKPATPELYAMVSFSMPDASMDRLADLSARAGATMVLIGLHQDSLQKTIERVSTITKRHSNLKFTIDPTLFRKFGVQSVPTFVLVKPAVDQSACTKACAPEDQFTSLSGDVTLDYALEYIAAKSNQEIASQAKVFLDKIRRVK